MPAASINHQLHDRHTRVPMNASLRRGAARVFSGARMYHTSHHRCHAAEPNFVHGRSLLTSSHWSICSGDTIGTTDGWTSLVSSSVCPSLWLASAAGC